MAILSFTFSSLVEVGCGESTAAFHLICFLRICRVLADCVLSSQNFCDSDRFPCLEAAGYHLILSPTMCPFTARGQRELYHATTYCCLCGVPPVGRIAIGHSLLHSGVGFTSTGCSLLVVAVANCGCCFAWVPWVCLVGMSRWC